MSAQAAVIIAGADAEGVAVLDDGLSKRDEAALGVAEERRLSVWHVVRHHTRIVWWCFFFSMSAIGWSVDAPDGRNDDRADPP